MELYKKLLKVKKEVGAISKDSTNPFFKSKYFDINKLIEQVDPLLCENGLVLIQPIRDNKQYSIIIEVDSGENIESHLELPNMSDPQKLGSCITYYRRYTLQSLLGLQAEDDDGNGASKAVKKESLESITADLKLLNECKSQEDVKKVWPKIVNKSNEQIKYGVEKWK